jgi:extracellular matrix regulatory protein A
MNSVALNVGFYNFILEDKIVALINSDSAPMRRMIQECRKNGRLIDATQGRKTKSVIFLLGGNVATSALPQDVLFRRLIGEPEGPDTLAEVEALEEVPAGEAYEISH